MTDKDFNKLTEAGLTGAEAGRCLRWIHTQHKLDGKTLGKRLRKILKSLKKPLKDKD